MDHMYRKIMILPPYRFKIAHTNVRDNILKNHFYSVLEHSSTRTIKKTNDGNSFLFFSETQCVETDVKIKTAP